MAKIAIIRNGYSEPFDGDQYVIELDRPFEGYEKGDIICEVEPFSGCGLLLTLELAIRRDGSIVFRKWTQKGTGNGYLHYMPSPFSTDPIKPTAEQIDTVNGLYSGRIRWEGLKLIPGATLQRICPIDIEREEKLTNRKIYTR